MLQMLGLRSSSHQSLPQKSPTPCLSPTTVGPARPLRFVYCDDEGKFRMDPEAIAALQLVKGPIGVVSVCGRARQGKSFILNKILGRSGGFEVSSTHRPCTKGIWMWSAPLKQTALDGTEYYLLLLDNEGIDAYDQTETYSTQIFSLAVVLSSMFIYNQMGGIDEAALDRLSLVAEVTKHIHVRASGERATASEFAQFSPVFVWLLRDFYLDLAEDNRKITPRDYLELALSPMQGGGKDMLAKNKIRESIRALFPDRECFTLVRPLNSESDLQRLDQFSMDKLRPEFRSGLDALTKYVFERTKPKQVGATVMTGPLLAGITKSFLDAINNGAVPTISSSWQGVEETECRKAYELATELYMFSFDRTKPPDEVLLREAHEDAVQKSLAAFSTSAVGVGLARQKYEKLLQIFFRRAFEDYKRNTFLEADLKCSSTIQGMEKKLQVACHGADVKLADVINVLGGLLWKYDKSSHGPGKWQKLATFLQQSFEGPIHNLVKKQWDKIESEKSALVLKCRSSERKLKLLEKQLEESEMHKADYLRSYDEAINDNKKMEDDYTSQISNMKEKYLSLVTTLDAVMLESSEWKRKYEQSSLKREAEEELANAEIATLRSRGSTAEARLADAHGQAIIAQAEASTWKRKYDEAVIEAKTALEKATNIQEYTNELRQKREDALRAEFLAHMTEKEDEIKAKQAKIKNLEDCLTSLSSELKAVEFKLKNCDMETSNLKLEIKELNEELDSCEATARLHDEEFQVLQQEKSLLMQIYQSEIKGFKELEERCKAAEKEADGSKQLADEAKAEAATAQKEKTNAHCMSMDRATQMDRAERHTDSLETQKAGSVDELERLHITTSDGLEAKEPFQEEANCRVEVASFQQYFTHEKMDPFHLESTPVYENGTTLGTKPFTCEMKDSLSTPHRKLHPSVSTACIRPVNWFSNRFSPIARVMRTHNHPRNGFDIFSTAIGGGLVYKPSHFVNFPQGLAVPPRMKGHQW